jgi:hypothetical protein
VASAARLPCDGPRTSASSVTSPLFIVMVLRKLYQGHAGQTRSQPMVSTRRPRRIGSGLACKGHCERPAHLLDRGSDDLCLSGCVGSKLVGTPGFEPGTP